MKLLKRKHIEIVTGGIVALLLFGLAVTAFSGKKQAATSYTEQKAYVCSNTAYLNVRSGAGTGYSQLTDSDGNAVMLANAKLVTIIGEATASNGALWYQIRFDYKDQTNLKGYVYGSYLRIYTSAEDAEFKAYLKEQGFPESYWESLTILHIQHPKWTFVAQKTGLDWETSVTKESSEALTYYSRFTSWKNPVDGSYNWETDSWIGKDGSKWNTSSKEIVAYFMDPRNFLTERFIFMFETLQYNSSLQTLTGVKKRLSGTFMSGTLEDDSSKTYAQTFIDAAKASSTSPYMLVARCLQEMGTSGTSKIISGTVSGYENLYNYFDIGAYTTVEHDLITNGLIYASRTNETYLLPWNTRYRSIVGGSIYVGNQYVAKGQDTLYLQKFNVQGSKPYTHQYMTNVEAPMNEAGTTYTSYVNMGELENSFVFHIPVYTNMPETAAELPTADGNPNPYLKSLSVDSYSLTPTFSYNTLSYDIIVPASTGQVKISASAISSKAAVSGTGTKTVAPGDNTFKVVVTSEYGTKKTYVINIYRMETNETITSSYVFTVNGNAECYVIGAEAETSVSTFLGNIKVTGSSTKKIVDADGKDKTGGTVVTGDHFVTDEQNFTIVVLGDVNGDGKISVYDMLYIKRSILKATTLSDAQTLAGDTRQDGTLSVYDMLYIKRDILGTKKLVQPTVSPTPKPTNTPTPTATPKPTNTPTATPTPKPPATPAATATPTPSPRPPCTTTPAKFSPATCPLPSSIITGTLCRPTAGWRRWPGKGCWPRCRSGCVPPTSRCWPRRRTIMSAAF